jgi:hypothetical protein
MAKATKKVLTDYEKIQKEFEEDFMDNELQERFDNFEKTVKHFKALYNELVPEVNNDINKQAILRHMIVESAKMGFLNSDAANELNELDLRLTSNIEKVEGFKSKFEEEEALIKKYKEGTQNKLFHYWKMFKALDKETKPWLEWKRNYDNRIF